MHSSHFFQWRILYLPLVSIYFLFFSCSKFSSSTDSGTCVFQAGMVSVGSESEADFKNQISAFNQQYVVYQKGETGGMPPSNPYYQNPYSLLNDPKEEPNVSIAKLSSAGDTCGLMIGFGKPYPEGNAITLYLILTNETVTRINNDSCKVDYSFVMDNNTPVYFSFNTIRQQWSTIDKSIVDRWVANLYSTDPPHAPVFKGYYIHHTFGKSRDFDNYLYVGLKPGNGRDTLSLFSLNKPLEEIETKSPDGHVQEDIKFLYTRFMTTSGKLSVSKTFNSPVNSTTPSNIVLRPCPPNCPHY